MVYLGSKRRLAKYILPYILEGRTNETYIEPFVGGGNIIDQVDGKRIGNDSNEYVIALLQAVRDGWEPPMEVTEKEYKEIRQNKDLYPKELVCFVGICCSFGGKWFGGYARNKQGTNYARQSYNVLLKQRDKLQGVELVAGNYLDLKIPDNSIIYCDPPYRNTTKYRDKFDHDEFYTWCRAQKDKGHKVFVSEYNMPADFTCIFEKKTSTVLNKNKKDTRIEKLFTI